MTPKQKARTEAAVVEALGHATDEQIEEVYVLIREQARTVQSLKDCTPVERMALAERYTNLRMRSDVLWVETGEPVFGTLETKPFEDVKGEADEKEGSHAT